MAASERIKLVVTNNKDSGQGSLRDALYEAQRQNMYGLSAKFDIVFESQKEGNSNLSTGYFTIGLKSPLKVERMDIRINHLNPRAVYLAPAGSLGGVNAASRSLISEKSRPSGSLLQLGSTDVVNGGFHQNAKSLRQRPTLSLNNIHFIRNIARGSDGADRGGGGGLGTGGAITVFNGDLEVQNSVFQDLRAEGGRGKSGAKGGDGGKGRGHSPTNGLSGGRGGLPSWHPANQWQAGASGGRRGTRGRTEDGSGCSISKPSDRNAIRGFIGAAGESNSGDARIGWGGGGAGGNGGAGWWYRKKRAWTGVCTTNKVEYENSLTSQPRGGGAGLYGGNGASGGRGGSHGRRAPGAPMAEDGMALGSAIAVWSEALGPSWNTNQASNIVLKNVNFFGNNLRVGSSGSSNISSSPYALFAASGWTGSGRKKNPKPRLLLDNVRHGANRSQSKLLDVNDIPSFLPLSKGRNPFAVDDDIAPTYLGLSEPRVVDVADMNNVYLEGSDDLSDMYVITFEDRSTKIGITQDLTDPANPLNKIWRELVPDEEDSIYASYDEQIEDYYSQYNQSYWDAVLKGNLEDFAIDLAKEAAVELCKAKTKKTGGFGCSSTVNLFDNMIRDTIAYNDMKAEMEKNMANAHEQLHNDIEANRQRQEELNQYLEEASEATFANFDTSFQRSLVIVKNFELGSDVVTFPAHRDADGRVSPVRFSASTGSGNQDIASIKYRTGSTADQAFAELQLSRSSTNAIDISSGDLERTLRSMLTLSGDKKTWTLGTKQSELIVLDIAQPYASGPAGVNLVVDRDRNSIASNRSIEINTQGGQDYIIGSYGFEQINTGDEDDIILPGGISSGDKPDRINGASGNDLVNYVGLLEPVKIAFNDDNFVVRSMDGEAGRDALRRPDSVIGRLQNIENFHVFGDSVIDFADVNLGRKNGSPGKNPHFSVISGAGSKVVGSKYDDQVVLSFYDDYNPKGSRHDVTARIEGGGGVDVFKLAADAGELFKVNRLSPNRFTIHALDQSSKRESLVAKLDSIETIYINDNPVLGEHMNADFIQFG